MSIEVTETQNQAINHYMGPALVIAGPGAGKTFVVTERVKTLILKYGINPKNILVTTFTEKAASELKIRLAKTVGKDAELIQISTIHSFCKSMLEKYALNHEYGGDIDILDEESQKLLIDLNKTYLGLAYWKDGKLINIKNSFNYINQIRSFYDILTQNKIDTNKLIEALNKENKLSEEDILIIQSYDRYLDILHNEKKLDFASLQTMFYDLINNNQNILKEIQENFIFILVDEYQDTSPIQDKIFRMLSGENQNLFVVGDENQSIYGFRGASIKNFKNFLLNYPGAKSYFLNINFRSTKTIVNFSNQVFEDAIKKELESRRREGEKLKLVYGEDSDSTAKETIDLIKKLKEKGIIKKYGDISLLFRSLKNHSGEYIKYLSEEGIPYVTFGDGKFLDREEIKTIVYLMSYVTQELYNDNKFISWKDWWRKDLFLNDFFNFSLETKNIIANGKFNLYDLVDDNDFKINGFTDEEDILKIKKLNKLKYEVEIDKDSFGDQFIGKNSLLLIFYKLLDYSGYFKRLMERNTSEDKEILINLGKLSTIINRYMDISKKEDIKGFLWYIYNSNMDIDQDKIEDETTIKLMTVHQAKGLQFPVVILCCLNEGRFPLRYKDRHIIPIPKQFLEKKEYEDDLEDFLQEERRLFYVGLTRAQDNLIFTASKKHKVKKMEKSRFLDIIPKEMLIDEDYKLVAEKEYILEKNVPNLNYSAINTFIDCPLRYNLIYEYGFATPPSFMQKMGTFIHNVLRCIHEEIKKGNEISPPKMREIVDRYWLNLPMSQKKNQEWRDNKLRELVKYYITIKDHYKEILAIEESFSHIDDNMIINGRVDLIVKDNEDNNCIMDFKARKKKGIEETNVDKQLQIYNYCLDKKYKINKLVAYTIEDTQKTYFPIDNEKTREFLYNISKKIAKEDYHKQKNSLCPQCQFNFYCWK